MADAEVPDLQVQIRDFSGLKSKIDQRELSDGGSREQVNMASEDIGVMKSRKGFLICSFED